MQCIASGPLSMRLSFSFASMNFFKAHRQMKKKQIKRRRWKKVSVSVSHFSIDFYFLFEPKQTVPINHFGWKCFTKKIRTKNDVVFSVVVNFFLHHAIADADDRRDRTKKRCVDEETHKTLWN